MNSGLIKKIEKVRKFIHDGESENARTVSTDLEDNADQSERGAAYPAPQSSERLALLTPPYLSVSNHPSAKIHPSTETLLRSSRSPQYEN